MNNERHCMGGVLGGRKMYKKNRTLIRNGIIKSFKEGNYASPGCPYGYIKKNRKLVVNEHEAVIVRLIHFLYLEDHITQKDIATYLNANFRQRKFWTIKRVHKILQNSVYVGIVEREDLQMSFALPDASIVSKSIKTSVMKKLTRKSK